MSLPSPKSERTQRREPPTAPVEPAERVEIERRVLAALCRGTEEGSVREKARQLLADYRWCEPVHQTVFEIVMSFPSTSTGALREQLPARLTRRGFPDFDFASLFNAPRGSRAEAEHWIEHLGKTTHDQGRPRVAATDDA